MDNTYKDKLMLKYGIDESDAEVITELKKRIRKVSPLSKEQRKSCEVCHANSRDEDIYNHHIMKVEYLAILAYYYDLYKKVKNPNYEDSEHQQNDIHDPKNTSDRMWTYVLKKDLDLYIPRVAICERHHNMIHELAGDYEGSTNRHLLKKAKPKELEYLFNTLKDQDNKIYENIFKDSEDLEGREYYISYLKIWNDTLSVSYGTLLDNVERKLNNTQIDLGEKNINKLIKLKENVSVAKKEADDALLTLNSDFDLIGEDKELECNEEKANEDRIGNLIANFNIDEVNELNLDDLNEMFDRLRLEVSLDNEEDETEDDNEYAM